MGNPKTNSRAILFPAPGSGATGNPPRRSQLTECDDDTPNPADAEHDRDWDAELTVWLARLAAARERLPAPEFTGELPHAVARAADMVNEAAVFAATHATAEASERSLADFMAVVGEYLAAAGRITVRPTGLWGRLTGRSPEVSVTDCGRLVRDLPDVLEQCFLLLGGRFRQRQPALAWMDTSGVFLTDLRRSTRWADRLTGRPS